MTPSRVIVVAGGPCAGKTKALAFLSRELTDRGWSLVMVPECATALIEAGISPQTATRMGFQTAVFELQLAQEEVFFAAADHVTSDKVLVVCDRGLMDGGGYLSDDEFDAIMREHEVTREAAFARYGAVFHLESVARSTHGTYSHKSNASRMEDPEEAARIDDRIASMWQGHPHWRHIPSCESFEEKAAYLLEEVLDFLDTK